MKPPPKQHRGAGEWLDLQRAVTEALERSQSLTEAGPLILDALMRAEERARGERLLTDAEQAAETGSFELALDTGETHYSPGLRRIFATPPDVELTRELVARARPSRGPGAGREVVRGRLRHPRAAALRVPRDAVRRRRAGRARPRRGGQGVQARTDQGRRDDAGRHRGGGGEIGARPPQLRGPVDQRRDRHQGPRRHDHELEPRCRAAVRLLRHGSHRTADRVDRAHAPRRRAAEDPRRRCSRASRSRTSRPRAFARMEA